MPSQNVKRKTLFFLAATAILAIVLFTLPFVEGLILGYLNTAFGISISTDGKVINTDGTSLAMMVSTSIELIVTVFHIIKIVLWMALVIVIVRFFSFLIFKTAFRGASQAEISSLIRTVLSIIIYIVAFFIIFQSQYPNVQLAPLFTGSTILGIVVGLALQDTLGNLFAGIALQADQPFQVGDVVKIANRGEGVVESVSWRGVKIRTFQNKLLMISNAVLGKETIEVAPRNNLNARLVYFNTIYSNYPTRTAQVVREAVRQVENVSQKIRPIVRIRDLGESGIEWEVKYWCEDYRRFNETDALIRQRIWYVFNREKIHFAFPTRTVHMEPTPEKVDPEEYIDAASEHIANVAIFAPLSIDEIEQLAKTSNSRIFAPGEVIVREGQEGNSMYLIVRGSAIVQIDDNGQKRTINRLKTNDFFGEMSLLTGEPRSASVVTEEETLVLEIRKSAIKPIFDANPKLLSAVGSMIEERRALLGPVEKPDSGSVPAEERNVIASLRKFFGLK